MPIAIPSGSPGTSSRPRATRCWDASSGWARTRRARPFGRAVIVDQATLLIRGSRPVRRTGPTCLLRRRLQLQDRAVVFVRDHVQQAIRTLPHVADALVQLREERLASQLVELVVEDDAFEAAGPRHFPAPRAAD